MMLVTVYYIASGCMQNYQKNIKKALLTDNTIMLWNDGYVICSHSCVSCATRLPSACLIGLLAKQLCCCCRALQEARIPPGPRLLILHHLEQYKHILKPGMPAPNQLPLPPQESKDA